MDENPTRFLMVIMGLRYLSSLILLFGITLSHLYPAFSFQLTDTQEILQRLATLEEQERSSAKLLDAHQDIIGHEGMRATVLLIDSRMNRIEATLEWLVWLTTGGGLTIGLMGLRDLSLFMGSFRKGNSK